MIARLCFQSFRILPYFREIRPSRVHVPLQMASKKAMRIETAINAQAKAKTMPMVSPTLTPEPDLVVMGAFISEGSGGVSSDVKGGAGAGSAEAASDIQLNSPGGGASTQGASSVSAIATGKTRRSCKGRSCLQTQASSPLLMAER